MKCAVIEYKRHHGEILPTLVHILNVLGVRVDVYTSRRVIRNDPFIYAGRLNYSLHWTNSLFYRLRKLSNGYRDYDFLVFGSIEPKKILNRISDIRKPVMAVIHNASLIKNDPDYIHFFSSSARIPLVLAEPISGFLSNTIAAQWVWPAYTLDQVKGKRQAEICFCVQGNLEFKRRNYTSLLDAVDQLVSNGIRRFRVMVVGRNNTRDGSIFKRMVKNRNLNRFFEFSKGRLVYKDYYESISSAHFILPLVDTTSSKYIPYFTEKLTSSIAMAVSLGVVPVIHKRLAGVYGIEEFALTYEDGCLYDALDLAMNISEVTLQSMRAGLGEKKMALLRRSILNIKQVLSTTVAFKT